jgi:hypothetical protein
MSLSKPFFLSKYLLIGLFCMAILPFSAQVEVLNGPELFADPDIKFNRQLGGDAEHFFVYRVRSRGFGTDFYLEKYSKVTLEREFIKVLPVPEDAEILDIRYAQNTIFLFYKIYNSRTEQKSLVLQTISPNGDLSTELKEIKTVSAEKSRYAWFKVIPNDDTTKFLVVTEHKQEKNDRYKINLLLMDAKGIKKMWEKELPAQYNFSAIDVVDYKVDNSDNAYFLFKTQGKQAGKRGTIFKTYVGVLKPDNENVQVSELPITNDFYVSDVEFIKNGSSLVCAGFYKDIIERPGRDLVDVGVFYYTFNFETGALTSQTNQLFNPALLNNLSYKRQQPGFFDYKIDYIKRIGNDVYLIGQQYYEEYVYYYNPSTRSSTSYWMYDYRDILVAKLNTANEIAWVKNIPFRYSMRMSNQHVFRHYFAYNTNERLFLFYNENPKNFKADNYASYDPLKFKYYGSIHGSNFIGTEVDLAIGNLSQQLVFKNEKYCFAPIQENNLQFVPADNTQVYVSDGSKNIIIYTEDRKKERFSKLQFK